MGSVPALRQRRSERRAGPYQQEGRKAVVAAAQASRSSKDLELETSEAPARPIRRHNKPPAAQQANGEPLRRSGRIQKKQEAAQIGFQGAAAELTKSRASVKTAGNRSRRTLEQGGEQLRRSSRGVFVDATNVLTMAAVQMPVEPPHKSTKSTRKPFVQTTDERKKEGRARAAARKETEPKRRPVEGARAKNAAAPRAPASAAKSKRARSSKKAVAGPSLTHTTVSARAGAVHVGHALLSETIEEITRGDAPLIDAATNPRQISYQMMERGETYLPDFRVHSSLDYAQEFLGCPDHERDCERVRAEGRQILFHDLPQKNWMSMQRSETGIRAAKVYFEHDRQDLALWPLRSSIARQPVNYVARGMLAQVYLDKAKLRTGRGQLDDALKSVEWGLEELELAYGDGVAERAHVDIFEHFDALRASLRKQHDELLEVTSHDRMQEA